MKIALLDPNDKVLGTLTLDANNKPVATGMAREIPELYVVEPDNPKRRLTPADGDEWLEAARWLYRTPYVRAVVVEERPTAEPASALKRAGDWLDRLLFGLGPEGPRG